MNTILNCKNFYWNGLLFQQHLLNQLEESKTELEELTIELEELTIEIDLKENNCEDHVKNETTMKQH